MTERILCASENMIMISWFRTHRLLFFAVSLCI